MARYSVRIEGEFERFTFQAEDGSYAVGRVVTDEGPVTCLGAIGGISEGSFVKLEGAWTTHAKYGRQFRVSVCMVEEPRTTDGIERYLSSGSVRGLGAGLAKRVVERFGLDTIRVLDEEPERLREVSGIGQKRLEEVVAHWEQGQAMREVMIALRGHGVSAGVATRIIEKYGKGAMGVLKNNPYQLAGEIRGVAFRTADLIAREFGISKDDPRRARAAVVWILQSALGNGHCYLPHKVLLGQCRGLGIPADKVVEALERVALEGRIVSRRASVVGGESRHYIAEVARRERLVGKSLARLVGGSPVDNRMVSSASEAASLSLNKEQVEAVAHAAGCGISVITGGPGTGKTTIVKVLMRYAQDQGQAWALCAPTGRAAKRLSESCNVEAKTIHRLLEYQPQVGFGRDTGEPLSFDSKSNSPEVPDKSKPALSGVLVDEASMVDLELMEALLNALPTGCRLVMVGDSDQLPSVGAGRVLADIIESGNVPTTRLTRVYRQSSGSGIIRNAHRILDGGLPVSGEKESDDLRDFFIINREEVTKAKTAILEVVTKRLPLKGFDPMIDIQVLTPMHKGELGTESLNTALQEALNPDGEEVLRKGKRLRLGDRVLQTKNNYDKEVFNGDVGRIVSVASNALIVDMGGRRVNYTGDEIDDVVLAYAISIHKSQGSEYPAVCVVLHRAHFVMLRRDLLYTGLTRASKFCCLITADRALSMAVERVDGGERYTALHEMIEP
jgi:exodeoxyribonuclease V alpha subunit